MTTLRVMTFNLRGAAIPDGENAWPERADLNVRTILKQTPDLIGFQEVQDENLQVYMEKLSDFERHIGPRYNNESPYCYPSIFWNPERLEQLEFGEFWLSKTPDIFSGDWDTRCIRAALWSKFRVLSDGSAFVHLNTHLDHVSEEARVGGSRLILKQLEPLMKENLPLIVTGDFNCDPASEAYRLYADRGFSDAFLEAGNCDGEGVYTFHAFTGEKQDGLGRIDWILSRNGECSVRARSCEIIRDAEPPLYPSDHFPVVSEIEILPGAE